MAIRPSVQYTLRSLNLTADLRDCEMIQVNGKGLVWQPKDESRYFIAQGSNALFRKWEDEPKADAFGRLRGMVENFIIVNFSLLDWQKDSARSNWLATEVRRNGFWFGGKHFVFYNIAPSKKRTARMLFVVESLRAPAIISSGFGGKIAKEIVEAEKEVQTSKHGARISLTESTTEETPVREPKTLLVPDYVFLKQMLVDQVNIPGGDNHTRDGLVSKGVTVMKEVNATDGASLMSPRYAIEQAFGKGLLTAEQASYMLGELAVLKRLDACMNQGKFRKLWAKVPGAFQKRMALDKGLDIVYDFAQHNAAWEGVDILVTPSQRKDTPADGYETPYLIANWAKPLTDRGFFCYLFIQNTNLTGDDLWNLTQWGRDRAWGVRKDYFRMLEFFGQLAAMKQAEREAESDDSDSDDEEASTELAVDPTAPTHIQAIIRHPWLYTDKYIQDVATRSLENFVLDMGRGRIPVEGSWVYMAPDPVAFCARANLFMQDPEKYGFDWVDRPDETGQYQVNGCLADDEFYCNGMEGEVAGFRSPQMRYTAVLIQKLVTKAELQHTKNVKVYPCHGAHHEFQDGADFDGDRDFMTWNKTIVDAVIRGAHRLVTVESKDAAKVVWNSDAHIDQDVKDLQHTAALGLAVNWNTAWIDWALHHGDRSMAEYKNIALTGLASQIIDFAKTAYMPEVPDELKAEKFAPHWREQVETMTRKIYHSVSPLGLLYDAFHGIKEKDATGKAVKVIKEGWWDNYLDCIDEAGAKVNDKFIRQHTVRIMQGMDREEVYTALGKAEDWQQAYGNEMADLHRKIRLDLIPGTSRKEKKAKESEMRREIVAKYSDLLYSLTVQHNLDIRNVFRTAYFVTYHKAAKRVEGPSKNGPTSVAFPWATIPAGAFAALDADLTASGKRLVLIHGVADLEVLSEAAMAGPLTVEGGKVVVDGEAVAEAQVVDGEYQAWSHKDRFFLMADPGQATRYVVRPTNNKAQFRIVGFKYVDEDFTAEGAANLLKKDALLNFEWVVGDERSFLAVKHNGSKIGEVSHLREMLDVMLLEGGTVKVTGTKVYSNQALIVDCELVKEGTRAISGALSTLPPKELVEALAGPTYQEVMARVNRTASYWQAEWKKASDFGISKMWVEWVDPAPGYGEQLAKVYMAAVGNTYVAEVWVSETQVSGNGRPELEVRNFEASEAACNLILRYADWAFRESQIIAERAA